MELMIDFYLYNETSIEIPKAPPSSKLETSTLNSTRTEALALRTFPDLTVCILYLASHM